MSCRVVDFGAVRVAQEREAAIKCEQHVVGRFGGDAAGVRLGLDQLFRVGRGERQQSKQEQGRRGCAAGD